MLVQVEVASFAVDPSRNAPLVLLREVGGIRSVAVPIGPLEASAIAIHSLQVEPEKPLTIDLVKIMMEELGAVLTRVVIYDVIEQAFQARLQIRSGSNVKVIDCRPCDALGLALRFDSPIFVNDAVFEKLQSGNGLSESEQLRKNIRNLDTTEFGRFVLE
ncbi:MAG: bifunctional nuclease family protein [Chitinispirillaceae bacterium]